MKIRDILTKDEVHFWLAIIGGVTMTLSAFYDLKSEMIERFYNLRQDIIVNRSNVEFIKNELSEIKMTLKDDSSSNKKLSLIETLNENSSN